MAAAVAQDIAAADAAATHDGGLVPLQALTPGQLAVLLRSHNLEKVATSFSDQGVRGEDLIDDGEVVSMDDLKEMGVTVPKQRRQIAELVAEYLVSRGVPSSRLGAPASATASASATPAPSTTTTSKPAPGTLPSLAQLTKAIKPTRTQSEVELKAGVRIVPHSDALRRHIPGLQKDLFTVTPLELIRKATDELTLGLHWFVLMTMVHSSVDAMPPSARGPGGLVPMKFDPADVERSVSRGTAVGKVFNYIGGEYRIEAGRVLRVDATSTETLVDSMIAYQAYAPARDWRMLLRHITQGRFDSRYYPVDQVDEGNFTFQQLGRSVISYLSFFAHRNCNVGDESRGTEGLSVDFKTRVTVEWAKSALDEMTTLTRVLERQKLSEPRRVPAGKEFAKQAFQELREAAISHLKAVSKIRQIFEEIYQRPATEVQPQQVLQQLEDQLRIDLEVTTAKARDDLVAQRGPGDDSELCERLRNFASSEAAMSVSSQFALFTLWTRFGMRHPEEDRAKGEIEEECKEEEKTVKHLEFSEARKGGSPRTRLKRPGTLSVVRVARHSLQPLEDVKKRQREDKTSENFVKKTVSFLADPRGATNLDIIHRALDAAAFALRAVLREAVIRLERVPRQKSAQTESDTNVIWLVERVCSLKDWDLIEDHQRPRKAPDIGKKYFKDMKTAAADGCPPHPGNRFFDAARLETKKVLRFLDFWPGWYDSRHMAEFFDRISGERTSADGLGGVFGAAGAVRRIRDRSFHGFTLLQGESISNVQLKEEVGKLRTLVEEVGGVAGIELDDLDEYQALLQLQAALPLYFHWRSSHHLAEKKLDPEARLKKALEAVRGMRLAYEAQGGLGKYAEGDASDESLEYLLRSAPSIAALGGPQVEAAAAAPSVQRSQSGFKALWADEVDEGEDDEEGEEGDVTETWLSPQQLVAGSNFTA